MPPTRRKVLSAAEKAVGYLGDANRRLEANPNDVRAKVLRAASLQAADQIEAADEAAMALLRECSRRIRG